MTNEDHLEVGKEYFLDSTKRDTGFFAGADAKAIYFTRGKGEGYYDDKKGFIAFERVKSNFKEVEIDK